MVTLTVEDPTDAGEVELGTLAERLRAELDGAEVTPARPTRGGDAVVIGSLAVALGPVALRALVSVVETWLRTRPVARVVVTIGRDELIVEHASDEDRRKLIDDWVARHSRRT